MKNESNILKNEVKLADEFLQKNKKIKKSNKAKKGAVINDMSKNNNAEKIIINNTKIYQMGITKEEVDKKLGIAHDEILNEFKMILKNNDEKIINKALKQIHPLFIATHLNEKWLNEQKDILVDITHEESIRKQAFLKINLLTKKDISILHIVNSLKEINEILLWNFSKNAKDTITILDAKTQTRVPASIDDILFFLQSKITISKDNIKIYKSKYDSIYFYDLQNLSINQIVLNKGRVCVPLIELLCKSVIEKSNDISKNEEYYHDKDRTTINRDKWTNWFSESKYSNSKLIKSLIVDIKQLVSEIPHVSYYIENNKSGDLFWEISQIGEYILKILNKSK